MKGSDRREMNIATYVGDALIMALIEELDPEARKRVISNALKHLVKPPDRMEFPVDHDTVMEVSAVRAYETEKGF